MLGHHGLAVLMGRGAIVLVAVAGAVGCDSGTEPPSTNMPTRIAAWGGDSPSAPAGLALPWPVSASVTAHGNPLAGATVTFTVISGGGSIEGATATSNADGIATSGTWTLGPVVGAQQVRAQAGDAEVFVTAYAEALPPSCAAAPDCGKIVFVSRRDGDDEIYTVNPDGTELTRLTNDPASDGQPSWSPDGTRIAFVSDRADQAAIYVMDADGSNVVRRTFSASYSYEPSWSPDGTKIAYTTYHVREGPVCGESRYDLWVVSSDSSGPEPTLLFEAPALSWAYQPAWSPDGTRLAFVGYAHELEEYCGEVYGLPEGPRSLFVIDADGSGVAALTPETGSSVDYEGPSWSPGGDRIAVMITGRAAGAGSSRIGVLDSAGSDLKMLSPAPYAGTKSSWSPDGQLIAFTSGGALRWVASDGSGTGVIASGGQDPDWRR